jgi:hypothetical protein
MVIFMLERSSICLHNPLMALKAKKLRGTVNLTKIASEISIDDSSDVKNRAAVALGRRGGLIGGRARAEALSSERRAEISKLAAKARWKKRDS